MHQLKEREELRFGVGETAKGRYCLQVLDSKGRVKESRDWAANLILDQGLDDHGNNHAWAQLFSNCVAGTGTDPTNRDSSTTTASRSGTTVTASAAFFEAGDVGRLIKFDSGEEAYITSFTSTTVVEVDISGTVASSEFTIWYVNDVGMAAESKRTSTYGSDSGDNGTTTTIANGSQTFKRTFIFSAETGAVTYNELGWSDTGSSGNNLFSRVLISGGVALTSGDQLKVVYELTVSWSPYTSTPITVPVTGWSNVDGDCIIEDPKAGTVSTSGGSSTSFMVMTPGTSTGFNGINLFVSGSTAALNAFGTQWRVASPSAKENGSWSAYSNGNFYRDYSATFATGDANIDIRQVGVGNTNIDTGYRILLDAANTKVSTHVLDLTFRMSWGRTLTNS